MSNLRAIGRNPGVLAGLDDAGGHRLALPVKTEAATRLDVGRDAQAANEARLVFRNITGLTSVRRNIYGFRHILFLL